MMRQPHFWSDKDARFPALALRVLSPLWLAAGRARAAMTKPYTSRLPVICVGNVTLGGAGKTPAAIALRKLLRSSNPCFLTRGYRGKIRMATMVATPDAAIYGDEAVVLSRHAPTIVSPDRAAGLRLAEQKGFDLVIADDGFQNHGFTKTASLLVIDGGAGLGNGHIFPAGPLREPLNDALGRAKAVLIIGDDAHDVAAQISIPVFKGRIVPVQAQPVGKYVAFAGIGRPEKFFETLRRAGYDVAETAPFPDHHAYDEDDRARLQSLAARHGAQLITTDKDRVRLPEGFALSFPVTMQIDDTDRLVALLQGAQ